MPEYFLYGINTSIKIINTPVNTNHPKKFNPKIISIEAAIIPKSAPIFMILATANNETAINNNFFE